MAKTQKEWSWREAEEIAGWVLDQICEVCVCSYVAGSVRRRRPIVHDIDLVVVPQMDYVQIGLFDDSIRPVSRLDVRLKNMGIHWTGGDKIHRFEYERADVDLYICDQKTVALTLLIRTGSQQHNEYLCQLANKKGYSISYSEGVRAGNEIIPIKQEEDLFSLLGLDYVRPVQREAKPWPGHYPAFKPEWME